MSFLKKKVTALKCPNDDCRTEVRIRCGSCRKDVPLDRYQSGPKRFVCLCGNKCSQLTCPRCGHNDETFEFTVARELGVLDSDMRGQCIPAVSND